MTGQQSADRSSPAAGGGAPGVLDAEAMQAALSSGQAYPLARYVIDIVRYDDAWWVNGGRSWARCDDPDLEATLTRYHLRMKHGVYPRGEDASVGQASGQVWGQGEGSG